MDTHKLRLFVTLAELQHFNRTAERSLVSPSKLSRAIQSLEDELQTCLFERDNRSVLLTDEGKLFLGFARETLQQLETVQHRLQQHRTELRGAISIYCSVTASYSFLYEILTDFRKLHPKIEIRLHTGDPADALERVMKGREDIAIAAKPERALNGVQFKRFTTSPLVFIAPVKDNAFHRFNDESRDCFWERIPLIVSERGIARERLDTWFRTNALQPNIYAQVSGNEALVSMVSLGFGIGLVPEIVVKNSPLIHNVKTFSSQITLAPYEVGICVLERRLKSPLIKAFWQQIERDNKA